jgi:hypothetical protein
MTTHFKWSLGLFNGIQAMMLYKDKYDWKKWREEAEKKILAMQNQDGSIFFEDDAERVPKIKGMKGNDPELIKKNGAVLGTAFVMAALSLPKAKGTWLEGILTK